MVLGDDSDDPNAQECKWASWAIYIQRLEWSLRSTVSISMGLCSLTHARVTESPVECRDCRFAKTDLQMHELEDMTIVQY